MALMGFIQSGEEKQKDINGSIIVPETFTHSIAFGETGCGKTSSYIYPNLKQRLLLGHGILLYDYKGKEHLSVKLLAEESGRLKDVVEIGKPWGEKINLIQKMDEDELDKFFDNILKHGEDSKFWQNSAKSLGQILLQVLKGIEDFAILLEALEDEKREYIRAGEYKYPLRRTLDSLVKVCKTFETLKVFIANLKNLQRSVERVIQESARKSLAKHGDSRVVRMQYHKLIASAESLKSIIQTNQNSFESFGEDSNENLTQNIIGSLIPPLISLSQNEGFNSNDFDIVDALNRGKIVIVNVESLSASAMESLNNSVLYELSKRTKSLNLHPISIFIDEVQRVVSKSTDMPIDVFREAKVDLFLATQNSSLLKEKLKSEKFEALMGNLTQKFYYKSSVDEDLGVDDALLFLEPFSFLSSVDNFSEVQKSKPLFLDDAKKIKIEYNYQKSFNVLENYLYQYKDKKIILDYDVRLYRENSVLVFDIGTKKEYIMQSYTKENILYLNKKVETLFASLSNEDNDFLEEFLVS